MGLLSQILSRNNRTICLFILLFFNMQKLSCQQLRDRQFNEQVIIHRMIFHNMIAKVWIIKWIHVVLFVQNFASRFELPSTKISLQQRPGQP